MIKNSFILLILLLLLQSCASKRDIYYFQDAYDYSRQDIDYEATKIQPNDILNISVTALVQETALPYNRTFTSNNPNINIDLLKLQGYLVSTDGTIIFPVLGKLEVASKSIGDLEKEIENLLESGGHLKEPTVSVRLLNAKVTVLGEVNRPGTYSFTEQNITLPQALGYAGDLTINGKRKDVLLIREEGGVRRTNHIDLTSKEWFDSSQYYVKPNDIIVVNPNNAKVKSAGIIGNFGTILTLASVILTSVVLITAK